MFSYSKVFLAFHTQCSRSQCCVAVWPRARAERYYLGVWSGLFDGWLRGCSHLARGPGSGTDLTGLSPFPRSRAKPRGETLPGKPAGGQQSHAEGGAGEPFLRPTQELAASTRTELQQEVQLDAEERGAGERARPLGGLRGRVGRSGGLQPPSRPHLSALWPTVGHLPSLLAFLSFSYCVMHAPRVPRDGSA